jgi:hypothetical protein
MDMSAMGRKRTLASVRRPDTSFRLRVETLLSGSKRTARNPVSADLTRRSEKRAGR